MSLTKVSYSMIDGAPINVLDFGADPTGVADSTSAFNDALAAGNNIYIPAGTFKVTSIVMPDKVTIVSGDGQGNTIIKGSGGYIITYGTNTASRYSQLNNLTLLADGADTCLRIRNLGVNLTNIVCRGGVTGILLQNSVASNWNNVTGYGSSFGIRIQPETSSDVVWLCNFNSVSCSGNSFADEAIGLYCNNNVSGGFAGFMKFCTFNQLDAEQVSIGVYLLNDSAIDNYFVNTWVEVATTAYIAESNLSRNIWINPNLTTGGSSPPSGGVSWSNQSFIQTGLTIQPIVNGGISIGTSYNESANVYKPRGPNIICDLFTASSIGQYFSNQIQKQTSYLTDYVALDKLIEYSAITNNSAIIEVKFIDNPAAFVEVELCEYVSSSSGSGGNLKYRRALKDNGTSGITFATVDTDYKNSYSDITFTSVNRTTFNLVYTWTSTQPNRIGIRVKVSGLVGQTGAAGVTITNIY